MSAPTRVRLAGLFALVVGIALAVRTGWGHVGWWAVPLLLTVVAVTEVAGVLLSGGRQRCAVSLAERAPLGLVALVVPLLLLWLSYDEQTARTAEARLFAELARLQEQASGRSIDVSAQVVLTAAARLFGGADVEMVLMAADGPVHYVGDESGGGSPRVAPDVLDRGWVIRSLGGSTIQTGVEGGRGYCSAVLGAGDAPLAVLIARRQHGSSGFG